MISLPAEALSTDERALHELACRQAKRYLRAESELLETIMLVDQTRLYLKFGLNSTFKYCTGPLRLSEAVSLNFIAVARKAREVPQLKQAIANGDLGVSKARKIVSILTPQNQSQWISKAATLPQAKLEREVAEAAPKQNAPDRERTRPEKGNRRRLEFSVDEKTMEILRKVQDLVAGQLGKNASLEETVTEAVIDYFERHHPLRKAARAEVRRKERASSRDDSVRPVMSGEREPIRAPVIHALNRRDHRRCQMRGPDGKICGSSRYLHYHHLVPVRLGGESSVENLVTVCGSCHRNWHRRNSSQEQWPGRRT